MNEHLFKFFVLGFYLKVFFGISVDIISERAIHPMMKENIKRTCANMRSSINLRLEYSQMLII